MAADAGRQQQKNSQNDTKGQLIFRTADPFTDIIIKNKIIYEGTYFFSESLVDLLYCL